jgi:hypothetical protein
MHTNILLNYLVKRKIAHKKPSAFLPLDEAKTLVMLVHIHNKQVIAQLSNMVSSSQLNGKEVVIFGLNCIREKIQIEGLQPTMQFIAIQSKDFGFLRWPKSNLDKKIPAVLPDLIMNFDHTADLRLTYVASLMPTGFMLGLGQANPNSYCDLTLSLGKSSGLTETFEHFCNYLNLLYGHDKA